MKIFDSFLKNHSKKYFLELSNLGDELDEISLKASFIFSRIDNIQKNIHNLNNENILYESKIKLSLKRDNLPLAKKAFKNWILINEKIKFYKNFKDNTELQKNIITTNLHALQDTLDSSYKAHFNEDTNSVKENIKTFKKIQAELSEYIKAVELDIPETLVHISETDIDIDIAFYDYIKDLEIE